MKTQADKTRDNKSRSVANEVSQKQKHNESVFQLEDNRPEAIAQRRLQEGINNSPRARQLKTIRNMAGNSPRHQHTLQLQAKMQTHTMQKFIQFMKPEEEEEKEDPLQGKFEASGESVNPDTQIPDTNTAQRIENSEEGKDEEEPLQGMFEPIQKKQTHQQLTAKNNTGLPDNLKSGIENLSGHSMDDVKVHYNSDKPAQLNAHAYAQGTDIHLGSGQEKHLPHEAWHVVQQKQGRVKPTMQLKGKVNINDDKELEKEADVMGAKSLKVSSKPAGITQQKHKKSTVAQLEADEGEVSVEQRELLDLADELQKNKSEITSVSDNEVEEAIGTIQQMVQSGNKSAISKGLKIIKEKVDKAKEPDKSEPGKETAQLSGWRFAGAIGGGLLGAIVGAIIGLGIGAIPGAIIGGKKGWKAGKRKDDINRLIAYGATRVQVNAMLAIEPNLQTLLNQTQAENAQNSALIYQLYADGATSAQITAMLTTVTHPENDAAVLHAQIQAENANSAALIHQLYATDNATSAQITAMLTTVPNPETDAGVLHAQIQTENANSATLIHQLYATDNATSAQITAMLTTVTHPENDAAVLHAQIQAENANSAALIHQLYATDNATSAQITAMLTTVTHPENDAAVLHAQIQAENANSATLIHQLYATDNATSAQITAMLTTVTHPENDAAVLHAQIQAENANSATLIHQLYATDNATSAQITAMLTTVTHPENDAAVLHAQIQAENANSATLIHQLYATDNATSAQITAMLTTVTHPENDAAVLHAQIQAENANSATLIHQLYATDNATSAQITAMLTTVTHPENDAAVLHAQIRAENAHSTTLIHQLYATDNATSAQITGMLRKENDAAVLHAQIQAENANSATLIHQLYATDNATSAQITAMLTTIPNPETDAGVLHTQIQTEADTNPARIHRLYATHGATSGQITAMLAAEPNAGHIHLLYLDGATQVQIAAMLAVEANAKRWHRVYTAGATMAEINAMATSASHPTAQILLRQIKRERYRNASHLHQLYVDGATHAQITRMLQTQRDSRVIHDQIVAAQTAGGNAATVYGHYNAGRTSNWINANLAGGPVVPGGARAGHVLHTNWAATEDEIDALLAIIPQPTVLDLQAQIQAESKHNASRIHQLYLDGATAAQITAMLAIENDARVLHDQIQAEATNSAAGIHQLYVDGAAAVEISEMLRVEATHSAADIHQLYVDGATTPQIIKMLAIEPNAQTLDAQIQAEANTNATRIHQLYLDGATAARITRLLAREANAQHLHQLYLDGATFAEIDTMLYSASNPTAQVLHAQILAEANTNATRIHQLYVDGATHAHITAMLTTVTHPETDARTLHDQIQAAGNAATVYGYYAANRTSAWINANVAGGPVVPGGARAGHALYTHEHAAEGEINALLGVVPQPAVPDLQAQIQAEANHNPMRIHQLYLDGATSAQITAILTTVPHPETDARILHDQIQKEAANSAARIHQLYVDGATSAEISGMLDLESNAQTLHNIMTTANAAGFTIGNYNFVTMANGMVGSIYFNGGRIRLTHSSQPEIATHGNIDRFSPTAPQLLIYNTYLQGGNRTSQQKYHNLAVTQGLPPAVAGAGVKLIEFFGVNGAGGSHPSRGAPVASVPVAALTQPQLNILYYFADQNDNATLFKARQAIPALRAIPIRNM